MEERRSQGHVPERRRTEGIPIRHVARELFGAEVLVRAPRAPSVGAEPDRHVVVAGDRLPGAGVRAAAPRACRGPTAPAVAATVERLAATGGFVTPAGTDHQVPLASVLAHAEGLICLTGGSEGLLNRRAAAGRTDEVRKRLQDLSAAFGDRLYVELQRQGKPEEAAAEGMLVDLAYELGLPLVATCDARFQKPSQHAVHDVLMCIANSTYVSQADRPRVSPQQYLKSPAEMMAAFSDLPEALESTVEIARRCAFRPKKHKPILPPFDTKRGRNESTELKAQAEAGLKERLKVVVPAAEQHVYDERLAFAELGLYEPHFDFTDSEEFKAKIVEVRDRQKAMVSAKQAALCPTEWTVDGSKAKGASMINRQMRLTMRAFNNECEAAIANVRWNNVVAMEKRVLAAAASIDKENTSMKLSLNDRFVALKIEELRLTHEYREQLKRDYGQYFVAHVDMSEVKRVGYVNAQTVAREVLTRFEAGEFDVATIFYNRFQSVISQIPTALQVIPAKFEGGAVTALYDYEPSEEAILADLLPRGVATQIFTALLENGASEQAARMLAMKNATDNAGEIIGELQLAYNKARQAAITKELAEIVGGAAASPVAFNKRRRLPVNACTARRCA